MVDQVPVTPTVCATPNVNAVEGDAQAVVSPILSVAASEDDLPMSVAPVSQDALAQQLNNIAPAAGPAPEAPVTASAPAEETAPAKVADVCEVPASLKGEPVDPATVSAAVQIAKPAAGDVQHYQVADNQNYNLAFDIKQAVISSEGNTVVIRFADGAVIFLDEFADHAGAGTKLIVDQCEAVGAPDMMQMAGLAGQLAAIAPAAGPGAGAAAAAAPTGAQGNTAPGNSGAGFSPNNLGGLPGVPGATGPLGPTDLSYHTPDALRREYVTGNRLNSTPGGINVSAPLNAVDETGGGGSAGDFKDPRTISGSLNVDYGNDGAGSIRIIAGPGSLTHHGEPINVQISADGLTATGTTPNGDVVFTFVLDPKTGSYTFTQDGSLDHPIPGNPNEPLDLPFVIRVTDADGDYKDGTAVIRVLDDAPVITNTVPASSVDETGGSMIASGHIAYSFGGDGAGSVKLVSGPSGLTSHGHAVDVSVTDTVVTGKLADGSVVFTLTLDPATGNWTYTQNLPLDHSNINNPDDVLSLGFSVRVTDYDGDGVTVPITINVHDDGPTVSSNPTASVDETGGLDTVSGVLPVSFGKDGPGSIHLNAGPTGLTSHGQPVTVTVTDTGAVGKLADGTVVFTLTLDTQTGAYTFSQKAPLDHPDSTNPDDVLNLGFTFTATDFDGDSTTGSLQISVHDDGPSAGSVSLVTDTGSASANGTLPFSYGADGAGSVSLSGSTPTGLTVNSQAVTVTMTDTGAVGKLADGTVVFTFTIDASGHYTYIQSLAMDGGPTLSLGYTAKDYDGDVAKGTITIDTGDGHPSVGLSGQNTVVVDETGGFDTVSGNLSFSYGPDGAGHVGLTGTGPTGLTSHGQAVTVTVTDTGAVGKLADGTVVFTLTVDGQTGAYTFTQKAPLDHPNTGNPDDTLNLGFGFTVTDADGDPATGALTVTVRDDGPSITSSTITVDESYGHDNVGLPNDGIWATATAGTPLTATGKLPFSFGQDGAGSVDLLSGPAGLTHHGQSVTVTVSGNTATGALADGTLVFTLAVNAVTGEYAYKQYASLDHANNCDPNDLNSLGFNVRVTDADGDAVRSTFTVGVSDDGPTATATVITVSQSVADDCNPVTPLLTATGHVDFSYGADGKCGFAFTGGPLGLYSDGQLVSVNVDGHTIVGRQECSGQTVFTFTVDPNSGAYTYTQYAELDHAGCACTIRLPISYQVTDADGDTASSSITIGVKGALIAVAEDHQVSTVVDVSQHTEVSQTVTVSDHTDVSQSVSVDSHVSTSLDGTDDAINLSVVVDHDVSQSVSASQSVSVSQEVSASSSSVINLTDVLEGQHGTVDDLASYVRVSADGHGNTVVQVDHTGTGSNFTDVAVMTGVSGVSLDSLVADGSLEVGRFLNS